MEIGCNFRLMGHFDVSGIRKELASLPESAWSDSIAKKWHVHEHTGSIRLISDLYRPSHYYCRRLELYDRFKPLFDPIVDTLLAKLPNTSLNGIHFSRHQPGFGFHEHDDHFSYTLCNSHRIHLPITTNPKVWFSSGGEFRHLAEGEAWDFNNMRKHSGWNDGDSIRIHCILDFARGFRSTFDRFLSLVNVEWQTGETGALLARPRLDGEEAMATRAASKAMSEVEPEDTVTTGAIVGFLYELKDAKTGEVVVSNAEVGPTSYVHGLGQLPAEVEKHFAGMRVGQSKTFTVPCEQAYGRHTKDLVARLPLRSLPSTMHKMSFFFVLGSDWFAGVNLDGPPDADFEIMDANHAYAGVDLEWNISVDFVRKPTACEAATFPVTGPTIEFGEQVFEYFEHVRSHGVLPPEIPVLAASGHSCYHDVSPTDRIRCVGA